MPVSPTSTRTERESSSEAHATEPLAERLTIRPTIVARTAHARERRMLKPGQLLDALAERRFEGWNGRQLLVEDQDFERLVAGACRVAALAESVLKHDR